MSSLIYGVEQPGARALPAGAQSLITEILGWGITLAGAAALGAFIWIGIKIMMGFRRNGQVAADALGSLPWVFVGGLIVASAAALANRVL